jgi:hypothetical protein
MVIKGKEKDRKLNTQEFLVIKKPFFKGGNTKAILFPFKATTKKLSNIG